MFGLGAPEIAIIAVIVLILFGPSQLPKFAKGLGSTVKEFKNAKKEIANALDGNVRDDK